MKDFAAVVNAYKQIDLSSRKVALATVVRVRGSSYRSPGARMLITDDGRWVGSISGGCLEGDALRKARKVMNEKKPVVVTYDTREESNQNLGISLGCNGIIDVLFESVDHLDKENPVRLFERFVHTKKNLAMATFISGTYMGRKYLIDETQKILAGEPDPSVLQDLNQLFSSGKPGVRKYFINGEEAEIFLELINPSLRLLIFGGGFDARPVSELARSLGWNVEVTDECVAHLAPVFFPDAKLSLCDREFVDRDFEITPYTACVLMSHNYEYDRDVLRKLIHTETPYIGILGPRNRFDMMVAEFVKEQIFLTKKDWLRIHSPIGLDIGAEAPDEIAVSIIAEIQAKFAKRLGGFLKANDGPIHLRNSINEVEKKS
ncbi:MAG: XdhC family protein [Bacteroidetes bacterium]|nr:XdhC family protein [Bacteroidota bacterium]